MPGSAVAIESDERVWFDAEDAAKYCQLKGLTKIKASSIKHATYKRKKLHMPDTEKGPVAVWHKDWLDEWIDSK